MNQADCSSLCFAIYKCELLDIFKETSQPKLYILDRYADHLQPCLQQQNQVILRRTQVISSQVCAEWNRHFKPKHDVFPTLTKQLLCLDLTHLMNLKKCCSIKKVWTYQCFFRTYLANNYLGLYEDQWADNLWTEPKLRSFIQHDDIWMQYCELWIEMKISLCPKLIYFHKCAVRLI